MSDVKKPFYEHLRQCGERWAIRMNRKRAVLGDREEWLAQQCLHCRYFIPLSGVLGQDWGVCSHPLSPFDGTVRFEHDGCDYFSEVDYPQKGRD